MMRHCDNHKEHPRKAAGDLHSSPSKIKNTKNLPHICVIIERNSSWKKQTNKQMKRKKGIHHSNQQLNPSIGIEMREGKIE